MLTLIIMPNQGWIAMFEDKWTTDKTGRASFEMLILMTGYFDWLQITRDIPSKHKFKTKAKSRSTFKNIFVEVAPNVFFFFIYLIFFF